MAAHNAKPEREQARVEILEALAQGETMTVEQIYERCPTASDRGDVARLCFEMSSNGILMKGDPTLNKQNKAVNTYQLNGHPPAADHPWKQPAVTPKASKESRITRDLPAHLHTPPPAEVLDQALIDAISQLKEEDEIMTEDTANYMTDEEEAIDQDAIIDAEDARLAIVDAMLAYAHDELRGNRAWRSLERAYLAVSGDTLEARHG